MDMKFLSIQAQDFIEENRQRVDFVIKRFLSIQAQDFIEDQVQNRYVLRASCNS